MKAKCPHCQSGCDRCDGGFFDVEFADGSVYTRACTNEACGFENGGRISQTPLSGDCGMPCVRCASPAVWKFVAGTLRRVS